MGTKSTSYRVALRAPRHGATPANDLRPPPPPAPQAHDDALPGITTAGAVARAPTVLVVDDEPMIRSLLSCLLEPLGYSVIEADNGADAVRLVSRDAPHVDLVLLDFQLPELDGVGVLRSLREIAPALPVILQTGHGPAELRARLGDLTADGVLEKPFRAETLASLVARALHPQAN